MRIRVQAAPLLLLGSIILSGWAASPATAQNPPITRVERDRARGMLRGVRSEIERRYYDRTFHGVDLARRAAELDRRIQRAPTYTEALELVAQLPTTLGDSHTFFVPPQIPVMVSYGWSMLMVGDSCHVQRVEPGSDAANQGVKPGDRVLAVNGDLVTREHLWQILYIAHVLRPQRWLRARIRSADGTVRDLRLNAKVEPSFQPLGLTRMQDGGGIAGLIRAAELSAEEYAPRLEDRGEVLVWTLPTFALAPDALNEARRLRGRTGLVLDLRGNGGGSVEALQAVLALIHRDRVAIGTLVERGRQRPLEAGGGGSGAFAGPVVALVDSRTGSAGEVLARLLQLTGRGVVLGDRTAGAVMHALQRQLSIGADSRQVFYGVSVSDAALVMPDGDELEKAGVTPDELILPTPAQMAAGEDPVMARAMAIVAGPPQPAAPTTER